MKADENLTELADDVCDDLTTIRGIGPAYARALRRRGIGCRADLAGYEPEELLEDLRALRRGGHIKSVPKQDDVERWISEARKQHEIDHSERPSSVEVKKPEEPVDRPLWRQHAGFTVFFDRREDESGDQVWQTRIAPSSWETRVYHEESGEEAVFEGIEPTLWVRWILEHAELPIRPELPRTEPDEQLVPTDTDVAGAPIAEIPSDTTLELVDVQVSEAEVSSDPLRERLLAEVCFQISGSESEALVADRNLYWLQVHTLDLENKTLSLVVSEQNELKPQVFEYSLRREFPRPGPGHYKLQSMILLLPPADVMVSSLGPSIRIVP